MADKHSANVILFEPRENALSSAMLEDAASILSVCRDRLIDPVSALFTRNIGRASDELMAMADRAANMEQQHLFFTANSFLVNRAPQLLQRFRQTYVSTFDAAVGTASATRPRQNQPVTGELSLVDNDTFEQDLAITKLSTRAAFNCSQQLVALDRRLAAMLRQQRIGQDDNPFYPVTIYRSLLASLTEMGTEGPVALILVQAFERQVAAELPTLYADINRYLAECGVLPTIPLSAGDQPGTDQIPPQPGGGGVPGGHAAAIQGGYGAPLPAGGGHGTAPAPAAIAGEDVFAQLLRVIQSAAANAPANAGWPPAPALPGGRALPMAGTPFDLSQPTVSAKQLIEALGDLQRGRADPRSMPGLGAVAIDPLGSDVLQQFRSTPMANWSHPMDAMTIDIVAMLFDAIFKDPELPSSLRAEIAKLQIPVLKVALLDKGIFTDRKHPVRRLLDVMATSGLGRGEHDEPRLLAKIRQIVGTLLEGFESDVQIFATQAEKLEEFLLEEEAWAHDKAHPVVDQLALRERKELAASRVAAEVEPRISRRQVPAIVADFIGRHWRLVLLEIFVREGGSGAEWDEALRLMDDLLWSVEPKTTQEERSRFLVQLPAMLKRLRAGLERVGLERIWDEFLSELIRLHMASLQKDGAESAPAAVRLSEPRDERVTNTVVPLRPLELPAASPRAAAETSHTPATPTPDPGPSGPAVEPDDDFMRLVQALEVGAWVEFQSVRGTRNTLRLNWVSEFKRVYLFTNRQGENAMTLAATSFADHLRKGTARLLSQNPLTDRAVAQILEKVMPDGGEPGAGSLPRGYAWE